jgi:hypothetical protein
MGVRGGVGQKEEGEREELACPLPPKRPPLTPPLTLSAARCFSLSPLTLAPAPHPPHTPPKNKKQNSAAKMNPSGTGAPTIGDKIKAVVKGAAPPALGGAPAGVPIGELAQEEAAKREMRRGEGGIGAAGATGVGAMGATAGTTTGEGAERVISRQEGTVVLDRPVTKTIEQQFVEHRPVQQHVETVSRITGETAVGGGRLEPVGPPTERVLREGAETVTAVHGEAMGGGAGGTTGMMGSGGGTTTGMTEQERLGGGRGGGTTTGMTEQERLEQERLGGGRGSGAV